MSELRKDPITGRWNIINTDEPVGPEGYEIERRPLARSVCPFCPGNERLTPPEIHAIREPDSRPNEPGWSLRVVPNKFPALRVEGELDRRGLGLYDLSNGFGCFINNCAHGSTCKSRSYWPTHNSCSCSTCCKRCRNKTFHYFGNKSTDNFFFAAA